MISKEDIQNLSALARLKVSDEEAISLQKDISNILNYVGQVSAVSGEEQKEAGVIHNIMRDDSLRSDTDPLANKREALLQAFPTREGDYNVVRKIIQKDE